MRALINGLLFQGVWFACVLGGNVFAAIVTSIYLFLHDHYFMHKRVEWRLVLMFFLLGTVIDGVLFRLGVFSAPPQTLSLGILPPLWLLCLWASVATLFAHSLAFLKSRYGLSALLGLIGPVFSYAAGAKLAGIELMDPVWLSLTCVALIWMLVLPFGVYCSEKWALYSVEDKQV